MSVVGKGWVAAEWEPVSKQAPIGTGCSYSANRPSHPAATTSIQRRDTASWATHHPLMLHAVGDPEVAKHALAGHLGGGQHLLRGGGLQGERAHRQRRFQAIRPPLEGQLRKARKGTTP